MRTKVHGGNNEAYHRDQAFMGKQKNSAAQFVFTGNFVFIGNWFLQGMKFSKR
jgi:hypothetical protein